MTLLAYQAINRKIGIALTSPDQVKREEFEQTAQEYSRAVSSVNERINKAYGFIQSGLVGEAVQECEREPNVIDSAQLLDVYLEQQWA